VILLLAVDKASQSKDIAAAKHYWKDFREAKHGKAHKDWNVGLAQDLRDVNLLVNFYLAAIEEGVSIQIALGKVIRAIGIKEFRRRG